MQSAIRPGVSLTDHARDLVLMRHPVIEGGRPTLHPRELVARSWARALGLGLNPDGTNARDPLPLTTSLGVAVTHH